MPTTPIYALPYPAAADPANVPLDMQELAEQVAKVLGGALSATPPASPIEGQLWALQAATGVVWMFRYNAGSASAYKWEFVGGSPMAHEIDTNEVAPSTAYTDLATVGPTLTLPRAGDYRVSFGFQCYNDLASVACVAAIKRGAAATVDADSIYVQNAGASLILGVARSLTLPGLAASDIVKMQYKVQSASTGNFLRRWIQVVPVRAS